MKFFLSAIALMGATLINAQTPAVVFSYDTAGNQTVRELICITCKAQGSNAVNDPGKSDYLTSEDYKDVLYYPNPLRELLYLSWEVKNDAAVTTVEVYSMSGKLVTTVPNLSKQSETQISFASVSEGTYNVILNYSNGEKKTLKIVKK